MDDGKLSLDLLIGLSIFLFTFIFIAQFLPTVFADVRSEISLANQAYRVATLLVEDPGAHTGGEDWEDAVPSTCDADFRPGFANVSIDFSRNEYVIKHNKLDLNKVYRFAYLLSPSNPNNEQCRYKIAEMLGLSFQQYSYKFNVSIKYLNDTVIEMNGPQGTLKLTGGYSVPQHGQIIRFQRLVYVDKAAAANSGIACPVEIAQRCAYLLEVVVWQ